MLLIYDPSSSFILRVKYFLVSLFISIQFFSREWQVITSSFEMFFYKPTTSLLFSLLVFQTTPFEPSPKDAFASSFKVEDVVFLFVLLFRRSNFYFSPGGLAMLLFSTLFLVCQDHILSFANPFSYQNVVISSNIFSFYQVLIQFLLFSIGVLPKVVLHCSSFLTECFQLRSSPLYYFLEMA